MTAPHLSLEMIRKAFGGKDVLNDISLNVETGELLAILGPSGCGKSTLLRVVAGLLRADRGTVRIARREMNGVPPRDRGIGFVFQDYALFPKLTVRDNVAFGLDVRGVARAERDKVVDEKLKLVRLDKFAHKHSHELSGGMQQRVGLARAFATDADILLMDEPFSALDPLIREHLQDELLELQRALKKTIVFVSHDLDEALKIGSRIAIMEAGLIVQFGPPEDIITKPTNDYVRRFVASMNPLNVLTGGILMRPLAELTRDGPVIHLDRAGRCRCRLDGGGRPIDFTIDGAPARFVAYEPDLDLAGLPTNCMVTGSPSSRMRAAIAVRQTTRRPLVLLGDRGELVGVVGEHELYRGMLKQTDLAKPDEPEAAAS